METSKEKKPVTWAIVTEVVKLSKLQLRNILKASAVPDMAPDDQPSDLVIMRILLADMLDRLAFLTAEQRALILSETAEAQKTAVTGLAQVAFADGRYCLWTGNQGFLDTETGDTLQRLPVPPMETISYNLHVLFQRGKTQMEKRAENYAKRQINDGLVDEPADVRKHPADSVS